MFKSLIVATLFVSLLFQTSDVAMLGLRIGDSPDLIPRLNLPVLAYDENSIRFSTVDGNELSVTHIDGKVVYMENDWFENQNGTKPLVTNFTFGSTTLNEVRRRFDSNGFVYMDNFLFDHEEYLVAFNCYEIESPGEEILVIITKVLMTEDNLTEETIGDMLTLTAVVLADEAYLDELWGDDKKYDPKYKKVKL